MQELSYMTIILGASLIATVISRRIGIPVVVGQILIGIILTPSMLGVIHGTHTLEILAEIGVILLMFLAGLESDFSLLKKHLKPSLLIAIFSVLVPLFVYGWYDDLYRLSITSGYFLWSCLFSNQRVDYG